jgi:predicted permease
LEDALLPVAMTIGLGFALRTSGFMPESSWTPIDCLVYHVLFPALLVREPATADLANLPAARMTLVLLGGDAQLMAALVTTTTLAALATLPLVMRLAGALA